MTDQRPEEIEREIERERSELEHAIEALQSQFSADALVEKASSYVKTHGPDLASSALRTARENPVALALTGVGLAMLLTGTSTRKEPPPVHVAAGPVPPKPVYDTRPAPTARGFASQRPPMAGFDERLAEADAAMAHDTRPDPAIARGRGTEIQETDPMSTSHTYHNPSKLDEMKARARVTAAVLRQRIDEGTSEMSDAARARVRQAREAAISAQEAVERQAREASATVRRTSYENPLLIGALAFGAGALLAASLPRTRTENHAIGGYRDQLIDEANRIFSEESAKLKEVAKSAVSEGKSALSDAISSDRPAPDAGSAVKRVSSAAKAEAERQGVGRIS